MDCLVSQRAGWEPQRFFDKEELRASGIPAPSFAEINSLYQYDKALNTVAYQDKQQRLKFKLNKNNQITDIFERERLREAYHYDSQGYLTRRQVGDESYGLIQDQQHPAFTEQVQVIGHQDIYQTGNQLYRPNQHYYEYDKAGRLISKVEKRDGFRQQETRYRWNGKNELIGITTPQGEVWHYKYDNLGRRIAKECPDKKLNIRYLWDGDQLAFSQTFKQGELISQRHYVFNGWQLIAQQDRYQQLKSTLDGNFKEWQSHTHYAIVQPNGKVLGLLTPEGKLGWQPQAQSLWGLPFSHYNANPQLDPQLLFSGQYYDSESGLAYNRFRYYDPETANYLSPDPIGLQGGETPYAYVSNPWDWVDCFGLSGCENRMPSWMPTKQGYNRHHIIPYELRNHPAFKKTGLNINSAINMIYLPVAKGIHPTKNLHKGWSTAHRKYNEKILKILDIAKEKDWSADKIKQKIMNIRKKLNLGQMGDLA